MVEKSTMAVDQCENIIHIYNNDGAGEYYYYYYKDPFEACDKIAPQFRGQRNALLQSRTS